MPAANDPAPPDCTLRHRGEIVALFERLRALRVPTAVECAEGLTIVSSILEIDRNAGSFVFDVARDPALNGRLFVAPSLAFTTELDRIRIAFRSVAAVPVDRIDGPAARVELPETIVRLQRRSAFRAPLPAKPPVRCTMLNARGQPTAARAMDLSAGGAAVVVEDPAMPLPAIGSGHALVLTLPEIGMLALDATLRTIQPAAAAADGEATNVRLGFRFESLKPAIANRIQRFVQQLEVAQRQAAREAE